MPGSSPSSRTSGTCCGWPPHRRRPTSGPDWRPAWSAACPPRITSRCARASGGCSRTCTSCGLPGVDDGHVPVRRDRARHAPVRLARAARFDGGASLPCMAAPSGSDLNPARLDGRYRFPSVPQDGVVQRTLESTALADGVSESDTMLAVSAVVTREGRVSDLLVLGNDRHDHQLTRASSTPSRTHACSRRSLPDLQSRSTSSGCSPRRRSSPRAAPSSPIHNRAPGCA